MIYNLDCYDIFVYVRGVFHVLLVKFPERVHRLCTIKISVGSKIIMIESRKITNKIIKMHLHKYLNDRERYLKFLCIYIYIYI